MNTCTASPDADESQTRSRATGCSHRRQIAGLFAAVAGAVAVFAVSSALGIEISVPEPPGMEMTPLIAPRVALAAAVSSIGAIVLARALSNHVKDPRKVWLATASAVLVISFVPSLLLDEGLASAVALSLMHVAVAVPLVLLVAPEHKH